MSVGPIVGTHGDIEFSAPGEVIALLEIFYKGVCDFEWPYLRIMIHRGSGCGDYFVLHTGDHYPSGFKFEYDANSLN